MATKLCEICGEAWDIIGLKIHKRREHVLIVEVSIDEFKLNVQLIDGKFLCPISDCGKSYKSIDSFKTHLKIDNNATVKIVKYEDPGQKLQQKQLNEDFSFERGCRRALSDNEMSGQSVSRAYYQTLSLGCEPVQFHLSFKEGNESISVPALVHAKVVKSMTEKIEFSGSTTSALLNCEVQLYQEKSVQPPQKKQAVINNSSILISKIIRLSPLPALLDQFEYQHPTTNLLNNLNKDFRMSPKLLHSVAQLHAGALVTDGDIILVLLTCEVYARSKSVDCHSETSMKSLPPADDAMFIGICEESDGRGIKKKLKIGSKHMNLLVTMSVCLGNNSLSVNIGPETNISGLNTKDLFIYYPTENISKFEKALSQGLNYNPPNDLNALRQLVSGFNDPSTYHQYRASAEHYLPFYETFLPSTIFTLCDLPNNDNYGVSNTAAVKIGSRFLSIIAASGWEDNFKVSRENFRTAFQMYHAHGSNKTSNQWENVQKFVGKLENCMNACGDTIDILQPHELNIGSLANIIGQALSTANKQIARNVETHLKEKFGHLCSKQHNT